jgi:hypothetical protein
MRLRALVVATSLLWPAYTFAQDSSGYLTGGKLYETCTSSSSGICLGYVMGVSDTLNLNAFKLNLYCPPKGGSANQELAVVIKYLRDHPETWHYSAASDVGTALATAFPCKGQTQ